MSDKTLKNPDLYVAALDSLESSQCWVPQPCFARRPRLMFRSPHQVKANSQARWKTFDTTYSNYSFICLFKYLYGSIYLIVKMLYTTIINMIHPKPVYRQVIDNVKKMPAGVAPFSISHLVWATRAVRFQQVDVLKETPSLLPPSTCVVGHNGGGVGGCRPD